MDFQAIRRIALEPWESDALLRIDQAWMQAFHAGAVKPDPAKGKSSKPTRKR